MHRCLRSLTPVARVRQRQSRQPRHGLTARQWRAPAPRQLNTGTSLFKGLRGDTQDDQRETELSSGTSGVQTYNTAASDALDFLLEGYEAKPSKHIVTNVAGQRTGGISPSQRNNVKTRIAAPDHESDLRRGKNTHKAGNSRSRTQRAPRIPTIPTISHGQAFERANSTPRKTSHRARRTTQYTKLVNVRRKDRQSAQFVSRWHRNFARIQNKYDRAHKENDSQQAALDIDARAAGWVEKAFAQLHSGSKTIDLSSSCIDSEAENDKDMVWMHCALWLLDKDKNRTIEFLNATHHEPYPPSQWVSDSLQLLAAHFSHQAKEDPGAHQICGRLADSFFTLARRGAGDPLVMTGSFVRLLLPHLTVTQVDALNRTLVDEHVEVHWHTFLHLSRSLARVDRIHEAIDAFLAAHQAGADFRINYVRQACAVLLRRAMNQPNGYRECLRLCQNLTELGMPFTSDIINILILNAIDAGEVSTAYEMFHTLFRDRVRPDAYTFAILLKGYRRDIEHADPLDVTIRSAMKVVDVSKNPVLAIEVLHCLSVHLVMNDPEHAWSSLCQAYSQCFDTLPLEQLGLPLDFERPKTDPLRESNSALKSSIGIMLRAFVDLDSLGFSASLRPYQVFQRFQALVESGTEPFASLASTDHCYNLFLYAFIQRKRTLIHAAEVIKDMQRPLPLISPFKKCEPTVQSWNIFLLGFRMHGMVKLAEQVVTHMRSKGIEPDQVTWEKLSHAYADQQDIDGLLSTLRRAEQSGATWTAWMERGLGRYRNSDRLRKALETERLQRALDFTSEIKEDIVGRLSSAEPSGRTESTE